MAYQQQHPQQGNWQQAATRPPNHPRRAATGWIAMIVSHFAIAAVALLGAILVFARKLAGAFLLPAAALLTIVVLLFDPILADGVAATMLGALCAAVMLLVFAALPSTLNYLRGARR